MWQRCLSKLVDRERAEQLPRPRLVHHTSAAFASSGFSLATRLSSALHTHRSTKLRGCALSTRKRNINKLCARGRPMISAAGKQSLRPTPLDKHSRSIYVSACAGISIPILPRVVTLTPSLRFDLIFFCEFFVVPPPSRTTRGEGVARGAEATGVRNMKRAPCPHPNWLMKV